MPRNPKCCCIFHVFAAYISLALIAVKPGTDGYLQVKPHNTSAHIGDEVVLRCSTSVTGTPVNWDYVNNEQGQKSRLFFGGQLVIKYNSTMTITTTPVGTFDLHIRFMNGTFVGTYMCVDEAGFGEQSAAALTLLLEQSTSMHGSQLDTTTSKSYAYETTTAAKFHCTFLGGFIGLIVGIAYTMVLFICVLRTTNKQEVVDKVAESGNLAETEIFLDERDRSTQECVQVSCSEL